MSVHSQELAARVLGGDRRALAKAITLIESGREADRAPADALLQALLPASGKARRIGLTGTPGAGKSTFIEAFGLYLTGRGHKVAVLAVDPSSRRSGGSILGDKTRMDRLSRDPAAFIRPSPSGGELGGVARRTREAILAVEAAGFDIVLVETVGVGQSETAVADMTDIFLLLHAPGGGDELQGVKRGIMELADIVAVNKADGDLLPAATRARGDLAAALHLMRPKRAGWTVPVLAVSALEARGVAEVWKAVEAWYGGLAAEGLTALRAAQDRAWLEADLKAGLSQWFAGRADLNALRAKVDADLAARRLTAPQAARALLAALDSR